MRIAFLGLGHMGLPMARNLLLPAHEVTVYNRTPGKAKALVAQGAKEATSVAEAVKNAEVVVTMLSDDLAIKEVVHGPGGLILNLPPKSIHLCMGTIEVETSAELAAAHAQAGQGYVAAPVFGRAEAAASRHIWIVAGGMEPQVNRCRPIFEALGQGYTRVGPHAAQAHALKLGGNVLREAMEVAVARTLTFAKEAGLSPADYFRFLNTAVFRSHMVDSYRSGTVRPSLDPGDKTLELVANEMLPQTAKAMGVGIPVEDQLQARIQAATARGWGEQDLAELAQASRAETEAEDTPFPALEAIPGPEVSAVPKCISAPVPVPIQPPGPIRGATAAPAPVPVPVRIPVKAPAPAPPPAPIHSPATAPVPAPPAIPAPTPIPVAVPAPAPPLQPESIRTTAPRAQDPRPAAVPPPAPPLQSEPIRTKAPKAQDPRPAAVPPPAPPPLPEPIRTSVSKVKKILFARQAKPPQELPPQAIPPIVAPAPPAPGPNKATKPPAVQPPRPQLPANTYTAMDEGIQVQLDLDETSHFELVKGRVWAWSNGKRHETNWNSLSEVELAFNHILFLLIKRHVLLRPDAVLEMKPTFTGGAKARVSADLELDVSRSAAPRLRELLGI